MIPTMIHWRRGLVAGLATVLAGVGALGAYAQDRELRWGGLRGETLSEGELAQGSVVVVVWASWSPRCRDLPDRMPALRAAVGGRARLVTMNYEETAEAARGFVGQRDLGAPVFLDPEGSFSRRYKISTLPGLLVLRNGEVVYRGRFPEDPRAALAPILD